LSIPKTACIVTATTTVNPSENISKIKKAILNIFSDAQIEITSSMVKATANIDSLSKIHEVISSRNTQKAYRRHLNRNLIDDSTWFYLNKQAAFSNVIALCDEADESPLGPIKIILKSKNIEKIIEWLVFD